MNFIVHIYMDIYVYISTVFTLYEIFVAIILFASRLKMFSKVIPHRLIHFQINALKMESFWDIHFYPGFGTLKYVEPWLNWKKKSKDFVSKWLRRSATLGSELASKTPAALCQKLCFCLDDRAGQWAAMWLGLASRAVPCRTQLYVPR